VSDLFESSASRTCRPFYRKILMFPIIRRYALPGNLPCKGASFWEQLSDGFYMTFCLPCSLAQVSKDAPHP